jgi:hypothetical protein
VPVDDRIGAAGEFILMAAADEPAYDRLRRSRRVDRQAAFMNRMSRLTHRAVHRLDDVATIAELAKAGLETGFQGPARRAG